jgi:hypothetical protein
MELNPIWLAQTVFIIQLVEDLHVNQAQRFLNLRKCVRTETATVWKWGRTRLKLFGVISGNGNPQVGILKGFFPGSSLCLRQRNMQSRNKVRAEGRSIPKWKAFIKFLAHVAFESGRGHQNDQWLFHTWTDHHLTHAHSALEWKIGDKITTEFFFKYSTVPTRFDTSNYPNVEMNVPFLKINFNI